MTENPAPGPTVGWAVARLVAACAPAPAVAAMLVLRSDEQEMTAISCGELSSPPSDDFVLMGGCSMGRWGVGAEILLEHLWAVASGR